MQQLRVLSIVPLKKGVRTAVKRWSFSTRKFLQNKYTVESFSYKSDFLKDQGSHVSVHSCHTESRHIKFGKVQTLKHLDLSNCSAQLSFIHLDIRRTELTWSISRDTTWFGYTVQRKIDKSSTRDSPLHDQKWCLDAEKFGFVNCKSEMILKKWGVKKKKRYLPHK